MQLVGIYLILSWRTFLPYRNQFTGLQRESMGWFLCDRDLRHKKVNWVPTAKNTEISTNFLVQQFRGNALFPHSFGRIACAFPQNFHDRNWCNITLYYTEFSMFHSAAKPKIRLLLLQQDCCNFNIIRKIWKDLSWDNSTSTQVWNSDDAVFEILMNHKFQRPQKSLNCEPLMCNAATKPTRPLGLISYVDSEYPSPQPYNRSSSSKTPAKSLAWHNRSFKLGSKLRYLHLHCWLLS